MINFISNKLYTNRYRDEYSFVSLSESTYLFSMNNLKYCRYGGKENVSGINDSDYGMVDPSGGPYMAPGEICIDGRVVKRIYRNDTSIELEVE